MQTIRWVTVAFLSARTWPFPFDRSPLPIHRMFLLGVFCAPFCENHRSELLKSAHSPQYPFHVQSLRDLIFNLLYVIFLMSDSAASKWSSDWTIVQIHIYTIIHTKGKFSTANSPICMFLGSRRKPENPEETQTEIGRTQIVTRAQD